MERSARLSRHDLVADHQKLHQIHPAKARGQRDVGGVALTTSFGRMDLVKFFVISEEVVPA